MSRHSAAAAPESFNALLILTMRPIAAAKSPALNPNGIMLAVDCILVRGLIVFGRRYESLAGLVSGLCKARFRRSSD